MWLQISKQRHFREFKVLIVWLSNASHELSRVGKVLWPRPKMFIWKRSFSPEKLWINFDTFSYCKRLFLMCSCQICKSWPKMTSNIFQLFYTFLINLHKYMKNY